MNETAEKKKIIHQGRNIKITRESKGLYQRDLADKLNKQQSDISKIESLETIEDGLLKQIALALDAPIEFLKNFDLESATLAYNNHSNITFTETSRFNEVNQVQKQEITNNFPIEQFSEYTRKFLDMQKELLEEKHQLDKENALLKQELALLKGKK